MGGEVLGKGRGHWASAVGFVLAAAGSAIGLGNIWKFPYITWENQGGAFVLVYLVCVAVVGLPIMTAEIFLGRRAEKDPVGTFRILGARTPLNGLLILLSGAGLLLGALAGYLVRPAGPGGRLPLGHIISSGRTLPVGEDYLAPLAEQCFRYLVVGGILGFAAGAALWVWLRKRGGMPQLRFGWSWVGALGVTTGFIILSYYAVVAGWTIHYFGLTLGNHFGGATEVAVAQSFGEFIGNGWLQLLYSGLFMACTILIVWFGVHSGIERAARILMPLLFAFLVILFIGSMRLDGAGEAMRFLFRPDFSKLTANSVLEAVGHAFFTLSLGMGAMITYGSYLRRNNSIPVNAATITVLDTVVALMTCSIIFPIIFTYQALEPSRSSGILFTSMPHIFTQMGGWGIFLGPLFFLLVFFAALTSAVSLLEVCTAYVVDEWKVPRRLATPLVGGGIYVFGILSALSFGANTFLSEKFNPLKPFFGEGRPGVFDTLDYLAANWLLPLGGMFIAVFTGWFLSRPEKMEELRQGSNIPDWGVTVWTWALRIPCPLGIGWILWEVLKGGDFS